MVIKWNKSTLSYIHMYWTLLGIFSVRLLQLAPDDVVERTFGVQVRHGFLREDHRRLDEVPGVLPHPYQRLDYVLADVAHHHDPLPVLAVHVTLLGNQASDVTVGFVVLWYMTSRIKTSWWYSPLPCSLVLLLMVNFWMEIREKKCGLRILIRATPTSEFMSCIWRFIILS